MDNCQPKLLAKKVDTIGLRTPAMLTAVSTKDQLVAKVPPVLHCLVRRIAVGNARPCPMPFRSQMKAK